MVDTTFRCLYRIEAVVNLLPPYGSVIVSIYCLRALENVFRFSLAFSLELEIFEFYLNFVKDVM